MWICYILMAIVVGIVVLIILMASTLKSQADSFGGGEVGWTLAVLAVLIEAVIILYVLCKLILAKLQEDIFIAVLKDEGGWQAHFTAPTFMESMLCCFTPSLVLQILTLPLNVFPVVGTVAYLLINAVSCGWDLMAMYYDASGMASSSQRALVVGNGCSKIAPQKILSNPHFEFGAMCLLLELVPVIGPSFFCLGNACGAALWAVDLEMQKRSGGLTNGLGIGIGMGESI
ncbi:hypothetical protein TrCOL_g1504 [Triparma columacea]|uniref:Uncharacterized protein n=1 Tax=Triparma columacea TaxID=722753 RepID=A0A9W7LG03_9STRA|nr:hypothetical protein TrCOL_g1504 [Triparma columacea]